MPKQVCVIGLGRFGSKLASTLFQQQNDVLAIDRDENKVQSMLGEVTYAVEMDAANEAGLRDLGVPEMDVVVVALGSQIQSSITTTMLVKMMGVPYVIARATDTQHAEILHRVGADRVVFPEEEAALRTASVDMSIRSLEYMGITDTVGIFKMRPSDRMRGRTVAEVNRDLESRSRGMGASVMILRRAHEYVVNPRPEEVVLEGDVLMVIGNHEAVEVAFRM